MPSQSLTTWLTSRKGELDQLEQAHALLSGMGPGLHQQINRAFTLLLASQFQGFCRDLHSECVGYFVEKATADLQIQTVLRSEFLFNLALEKGNAQPGGIGSDFNRLGIAFWTDVLAHAPENDDRKKALEALNDWRNGIAHDHFDEKKFDPRVHGSNPQITIELVREFREACNELATSFDVVMVNYLTQVTGIRPW
jgi:hypothetical protein